MQYFERRIISMTDFNHIHFCGCSAAPAATFPKSPVTESALSGVTPDRPREDRNDGTCACCKRSLRDALKLLCSNTISDVVDFDAFAFLTDSGVVGATPTVMTETDTDNLGGLTGTFRRFSPCNCDLIDIEGIVTTPFGATIEVDEANLCALSAIVFQLLPVEDEGDTPAGCCPETTLSRYRRVRDLFQCELVSTSSCGECLCDCDCSDDCCCASSVLSALSGKSLNKRATLTAGLLAVRDVTALGTIGNVLVLGNEEESRFYFVCANKVDFFA